MATSDDTEKNAPLADVSDSEITSLVDDVLKSGKQVPVMPLAETTAEAERMHARVIATQMKRLAEQLESPSSAPALEEKDEWWFEVSGQRLGPLSLQKIRFLWEDGELTPDSLCWREGLSAWVPLFKISDLAHALSPKGQPLHQKVKEVTANLRQPAPAAPTGWRPSAGEALERSARERLEAAQRREPEALEAPVEHGDESARSFQLPALPALPAAAPEEPKRSGTNVPGSIISGLVAGLVVVAAIVGMRWLPMLRPAPVMVPVPAAAPPTPPPPSTVVAPAVPPPAAAPMTPPAVAAAPAAHPPPAPVPPKAVATTTSSEEHPKPPPAPPSASAKSPAARGKPQTVEDSFAQEFAANGATPLSLTSSQIMEVVAKHRSEVSRCIQAQHAQAPDSSGRLVMRWSVHLDGHVADVSVKSEDLADSPLAQCLSKIIPSWTFPEHEVEHPPVEIPFPF